jgi:hypothetical protein
MTAPHKVVELPIAVIAAILTRADLPPQATDVATGQESPTSQPRQELPSGILNALRKARLSGDLIEDRSRCRCRGTRLRSSAGGLRELAIQPGVADTERARFGAAADTI